MSYKESFDKNIKIEETYVVVSDGISIKTIDFTPHGNYDKRALVVFVAGWVSEIWGWADVLKELAPVYRTIYIETREKKSAIFPDGSNPEFNMKRMALDIEEIINKKKNRENDIYIAGSSLGSTVILHYLGTSSPDVKHGIILSPVVKFDFPLWFKFILVIFKPFMYVIIVKLMLLHLRLFRLNPKKEPEQYERYSKTLTSAEPSRLHKNACAMRNYDLYEKLPNINRPVTLVGAKTDKLHGIAMLEELKKLIKDADLKIMESNKETHSGKFGKLILDTISD